MPRNCIAEGCSKRAWFNIEGEINTLYCVIHKKDDMKNIRSKKCREKGCDKHPSFNYEGLKAEYCLKHKEENMIMVKMTKCQFENCKKRANYKNSDDKNPSYCFIHKSDGMITHSKHKTCEVFTCNKSALYNFEGLKTRFCKEHKEEGMIMINNKCNFVGCKISKCYSYEGEPAKFCFAHKLDEMIDVRNACCEYEDCNKQPSFNYDGFKNSRFCLNHKLDGMIDIKNRKKNCITESCSTFTNDKYKGYCLRCFIHLFPDEPVTRNYKTKETAVVQYILSKYSLQKYSWILDKKIFGGCSKKRPDLLLDLGYQVLIIEIDENQHIDNDNSCENKRLMELSQDVDHRSIVCIRFNPDYYINSCGEKISSCWELNKKGICSLKRSKKKEWNERLINLKSQIDFWINPENKSEKTIEIIKLYYSDK